MAVPARDGVWIVERTRRSEVGWFPAKGSYEEAVLSWQEQIEMSFRRRELGARRAVLGPRDSEAVESERSGAPSD